MSAEVYDRLIGQTVKAISGKEGGEDIVIDLENGERHVFYHEQDCCESFWIEDICGDLNKLVGKKILMAEQVGSECANGEKSKRSKYELESATWTFLKIGCIDEVVTVRMCGESNGYYSEDMDYGWIDSAGKENAKCSRNSLRYYVGVTL